MLLSQVAALLKALGLTQSIFKPIPDLVNSVDSTVDGLLDSLGLSGPLSTLPLVSSILEVKDTPNNQSPFEALSVINGPNDSCIVEPYDPPPVLSQTFPPFDQVKANIFRYRQQQAVNLGSWFVHEQWMTPSLFTCASGPKTAEIDIASGWGNTTGARTVLERHWDTFITQDDFKYLASIGINTVRLPIGYWNLGPLYCQGTPFENVAEVYTNSWSRVVRSINWAGEAGIGVLVDVHGAVGSQNGQAHSGISDDQAQLFLDPANQDDTIKVLTFLAQQLAPVTNVVGIQILNEPNDDLSLPAFYNRSVTAMRQVSPAASSLPLYIHDAFNLEKYREFVSSRTDFVVEDHHSYFVFGSSDASQSADQESEQVKSTVFNQLSSASQGQRRNLIVGEWSCALTTQALSGENDPMGARQQFCQGQEEVYSNVTAGWHFWSYTKEGCDGDLDWCFKNAVGKTLPSLFFAYDSTAQASQDKTLNLARAVAEMDLPPMTTFLGQAANQPPLLESTDATDANAASNVSLNSTTARSRSLRRGIGAGRQRFLSIHSRRSFQSEISKHKKDGIPSPLAGLNAAERSITKGYSDGYLTAQIFAQNGLSKLGFKGQYISDSIVKLGPSIVAPETEDFYRNWFERGLTDGEAAVDKAGGA